MRSFPELISQVYVTLLASIPTISLSLRLSITQNLSEIVELHEELLGDLHRAVPHSEYNQLDCARPLKSPTIKNHNRWRSLDAVPEHIGKTSWLETVPGVTAEPKVAAEVANIFGQKVS
jgi:hypothetical protein